LSRINLLNWSYVIATSRNYGREKRYSKHGYEHLFLSDEYLRSDYLMLFPLSLKWLWLLICICFYFSLLAVSAQFDAYWSFSFKKSDYDAKLFGDSESWVAKSWRMYKTRTGWSIN
jgi:hypothetical protein